MPSETEVKAVTFPPGKNSWTSPERVDYVAKFLQALFFLLALPYLFVRLIRNPPGTLQGATSIHAAA
jgi:hypothetical protein